MIKFCPQCKGILFIEKDRSVCRNCNYVLPIKLDLSLSEKIPEIKERGEGTADHENVFATYSHECKKCGHDKAEIIDCGVFYSDEDNLIFLKCGKCGFSERIGRKVS